MICVDGVWYNFSKKELDEMIEPSQTKWVAVADTNCPNCGAVITGLTCEYCGTRFRRKADPGLVSQLLAVRNKQIERQTALTELYQEALMAMRNYGGTN